MNLKKFLTTSCLCAFAATTAPIFAKDEAGPPPPPPPGGHEPAGGKGPRGEGPRPERPRGEGLSPEDREKLRAAREQAMQDESVKAAREKMRLASEEFRKVLHPALLAVDPSLAPILAKMERAEKERMDRGPGPGAGGPPGDRPGGAMSVLTKEEREKLDAAREKVRFRSGVWGSAPATLRATT